MTARKTIRAFISLLALMSVSACTTMVELPDVQPFSIATQISVGDKVAITTKSGDVVKMRVDEMDNKGLRGDDDFVAYSDMESIAVRRPNERANENIKTTFKVVGVVTLYILEAAAQAMASY